ncbi:hypothetical protein [Streptomyces tagetis]|uniref:Uncharacterized protein n=1 Tax=Streptomyces tagetis TaxID=2820809 RepID=A0A940XQT2_9ACTN|nr:hypothetical protein [Streptomyces sp. RG38]MBQ0829385.1 hypothetical protein [Streptomyces sp. RG38]
MADLVETLSDVILKSSETVLRTHGACPRPQVHILAEDMDQPYVGFVTCRLFYRGADAASALAGLGLFPSVLMATRVLVVWEDCDLRTALESPGDSFATGVVILDAGLDEHTLNWHPFDVEVGGTSPHGIPTVIPRWGTTAHYKNVRLPAPVAELLGVWREFRQEDIQETAIRLQEAGYEFDMVTR